MIYVDDMYQHRIGRFRGMKMSHMIADTPEELRAFALVIGLKLEWIQHEGTAGEHFDISLSARRRAVEMGAVEISMRELVRKCMRKAIEEHANTL